MNTSYQNMQREELKKITLITGFGESLLKTKYIHQINLANATNLKEIVSNP